MIVDPYGNITEKLEFNKPGVIENEISISNKKTFYTKYGNLFSKINIVILLLMISSVIFGRFYRHQHEI